MQSRALVRIVLAATLVSALRCGQNPVASHRIELVGAYAFQDARIDRDLGTLTLKLREDGTYVETHTAPGSNRSETNEGTWQFVQSSQSAYVTLRGFRSFGSDVWKPGKEGPDYRDNASLSLERRNGATCLVVNEDAGQYFCK